MCCVCVCVGGVGVGVVWGWCMCGGVGFAGGGGGRKGDIGNMCVVLCEYRMGCDASVVLWLALACCHERTMLP